MDAAVETRLIVQALRVNTLSKLAFNDSKLFDSLVLDVFPGVTFQDIAYVDLRQALLETCKEMNLEVIDSQVSSWKKEISCRTFDGCILPRIQLMYKLDNKEGFLHDLSTSVAPLHA